MDGQMYVVNGADQYGVKTSEHPTLAGALERAAEFLDRGMFNVTILDLETQAYAEADIDLLMELVKAESQLQP